MVAARKDVGESCFSDALSRTHLDLARRMEEELMHLYRFRDRKQAGQELGRLLKKRGLRPSCVLGLTRGGVPVAQEVAHILDVPLDICVVRKVGVPGHVELAMGAIAAFGQCVLNDDIIHACHVPHHVVDDRLRCEAAEVERRELRFRRGQPAPDLSNQIVLLVDDGLATGATMRAAIRAVQSQKPASIHVAVPVAAADSTAAVRAMCQTFAAIEESDEFDAVGSWYEDFSQVSDEEVCQILDQERGSKHERFQVSKDRGQNRVP